MSKSSDNKELAIRVDHVKKDFYLPHEKSSKSLKSIIVNMFHKKDKSADTQHALKDISFDVEKGDFFGIVGRNGSGKSTLLKIIAQIYQPTGGKVQHYGKLVPFIELGVGFNPELSGRENVYLNGALLGFTREEIDAKYDDIVDFAELHGFMDQKLKNYSSGMQVRLAFSVATRAEADILVLDEVLAVGDEAFQRKCNRYFESVRKKGKTIILVTHNMESVRKYCNKAIMIRDGVIVAKGSPDDVSNEYSMENLESPAKDNGSKETAIPIGPIKNLSVKLLTPKIINQGDNITVEIKFNSMNDVECFAAVVLQDIDRNIPLVIRDSSIRKANANTEIVLNTTFSLPSINDSNIKVLVNVRDKKREILAYYPDDQSPIVALRRNDYPEHRITDSILYDYKEWDNE